MTREVVHIFERVGARGGGIWWLVLECGHSVARKMPTSNPWRAMASLLTDTIRTAPKRCRCMYCESGIATCDPQILIDVFSRMK